MEQDLKKQIGQRIKESRIQANLTQREVSEKLGIVLQQYKTYESGRYELDYKKLTEICKILDVSDDFLLGLTDYK